MTARWPIYVHCTGQDDNIGDVVLRRRMLNMLREHGELRILLRSKSAGFLNALDLGPTDAVFSRRSDWLASASASAARVPTVLVNNPGEMLVGPLGLFRQVWLLPLRHRISRSGGIVVQLGVGARHRPGLGRGLFRAAFRYHHLVCWRDPVSQEGFGFGSVMPDWGFADHGPGQPAPDGVAGTPRERWAISLRADRPYPGPDWLRAVRRHAATAGLRPVVVTQVRRDQPRSERLARDLGADLLGWGEQSHAEQEARLRALYRRCRLALSDRLHVLVLAMTEGAIPLCVLDRPEDKIGRHFDAIGYPDASHDLSGGSADEIAAVLEQAGRREAEARACHARAGTLIRQVENEFRGLLLRSRATSRAAPAPRVAVEFGRQAGVP